ncbi:NUDIX domain-containing protein [Zhihengliuella sp. ISTPL4]|uniref:NUDIX domain-containing protein n=1 Tax=Zhihengliuella sp. ISTPL4 TaxID=2058657 RepID=UPI000C7B486E|nr:NUDIX hydrolase [Zhihengliuella sp. ISTPL4]
MGWITHASRTTYENAWIRVREDDVTGPGGRGIYGVMTVRNPAVFIVALDADDRVCLVNIDRYTIGPSIEVPAGGTDGEDPLRAAERELREETGYLARQWDPLGITHALDGVAEATEHVYLAREIERVGDAAGSRAEEGIDTVEWVAFSEVLRRIADGRITDSETIAAIALAGVRLGRFR